MAQEISPGGESRFAESASQGGKRKSVRPNNTQGEKELGSILGRGDKLTLAEVLRHIEPVQITRIEDLAGRKHHKDSGQDHPGNGNNRPFLPTTFDDALVLGFVVTGLAGLNRCMSSLNQGRFEINAGAGNPDGLLLAGRFVVTWC